MILIFTFNISTLSSVSTSWLHQVPTLTLILSSFAPPVSQLGLLPTRIIPKFLSILKVLGRESQTWRHSSHTRDTYVCPCVHIQWIFSFNEVICPDNLVPFLFVYTEGQALKDQKIVFKVVTSQVCYSDPLAKLIFADSSNHSMLFYVMWPQNGALGEELKPKTPNHLTVNVISYMFVKVKGYVIKRNIYINLTKRP